ncbi:6-phospho-beta-glucosidase [Actinoallomurus iriomotensis]|uniref:6-phospho-beta-glucosidase n=1 Tax=Actinoallomurus iriomotensis TaxID=478107 RepID=A0A9W6SFG4_9ACTN|nr:6-phospho-beta-glucosidase [Actinoallomurus iriomotensis]GLY91892.1 6-phospho-beta-glucosidase [Actinoallomurus iriomotensis]
MKLTIVGGGSTYTPELIDGLVRLRDRIDVTEIALQDVSAERLDVLAAMSRRMLSAGGHPAAVTTHTDIAPAAEGAQIVLVQLRVGGQAARLQDETLPLRCDCLGQETTGAGGLAKALRTVPVMLDVAERVRAVNPDAWLIDFTNPVGIVTRALLTAGHTRVVGLCSSAMVFQRHFAKVLGVEPSRIALDHVGLNHLTWERRVLLDGEDVLPRLLGEHGEEVAPATGLPIGLLRRLGTVPSYYLHYYYAHDEVVAGQQANGVRAQEVMEIEGRLLSTYADESVTAKPELLTRRGGAFYSEAALDLMASLRAGDGRAHVVNVRNGATLPFLSEDSVIEVPATVGADGPVPLPSAPVEPLLAGLIANVTAYEHLALEAAVHGGRDRVFRALLAHPLVGQYAVADRLTDLLLEANRAYLPWAV